ncbi:Rap1-interacting factor 1 N terminal [Phytophthora infestans]|uniref:Rap1-interacting factor 1 N terminal n=1 Tax=Phytophthora infestans TaxID=4787 RepID=A0A833WDC0_PHYIN|nr:Rap1-interacting factor 1 N terminal [Phytophthora infestans]KAF4145344.1 Rap1-interacting factor 1 N terminal [Phytophthora infestans]
MEAEAQLARALVTLTGREFPLSRGKETRIDAYLQLEDLLCLEDSEESVLELQRHVPSLLSEIRYDLQHKTLSDVLHAALRCLSYLMHHYSLAAAFSDEHMTFFLGELVHLLFSTQDQSTYKLCLWGLTMQNFPAERHKLLSRTVEGLVQAVVNPFKSRAIEVQALKGLHLLLVKYPEQLGVDGAVLGIYVRPIASRLASSETATRTQARLILEEASKHLPKWSQETLTMVQHCAEKYMLPVMKLHMENDRQKDAVCLWKLTLVLLKSQFSNDLGKLNQVLYVPEKCMEDEDAAARLMAMQAWSKVVEIFHECHNWLFNKAVVSLLVWPIKLSLEQELLLNVVDAAFESWRRIVSVAVCDFNAYCKAQQQAGEQQNVPEWKFWFGELVMTPLLTLMKERMRAKDSASTVELDQFIIFTKQLCELEKPDPVKSKNSPSRIEDSSNTTLGGSSVDASTASKGGELKPVEVQSCGSHITSELIGVAFLLEDIFGAVQHLIKLSDESGGLESKRRVNDLVVAMWKGVCNRIHLDSKRDGPASNFELRLVRMCIDFCFGILTSTSTSAEMLGVSSPTNQADKSTEGRPAKVVLASVGFGLEWQLQLFAPLVSGVATPRDLQTVILHPKSKLSDHITQRMEYLKNMYVQCAAVLQRWKDSELLIDFTAKENALPYLVINLLFEYSVFVDDTNNDNSDAKYSTLTCLETVVNKLSESMKAGAQHSRELDSVVRFSEESIRAAHDLLAYDFASGKSSMLDELVSVSKGLTRHAFASRQNASLSVDLCQSRGKVGVVVSATASTASSATASEASDAEEKNSNVVLQVSASLDPSSASPCLLSGEVSTIPSASPVETSPASSADERPKRNDKQSPDQSATTKETTIVKTATPQHAEEAPTTVPAAGSQSAPPRLRTQRSLSQCIYPDLVGCTEAITLLYRHFPLGFRPFFSFYKIKTIGDLSALPVEKVRTFGLKEPVSTVRRALEEFNGRKDRMKTLTGSPFRQRSGSASTSPAIPTPSPHKPSKRPFHLESGSIAPLSLEKRDHKRTKRSLVLDGEDGDEEESEGTRRKPKLADRVTFCLQTGETGETRITRPGEDSQDQLRPSEKVEEKESAQEKMDTYTLKLLQHLRRSAYYMDKLVAEEESMQSEEASLGTTIANVGGVITNYQEAHDLVSRLASQLQIAAETSSKRCRKLLDKRG